VAALVLVAGVQVVGTAPAEALPGSELIGHRCRTYDDAVTNEDTVAALVDTSAVPGATCEVDVWRLADNRQIIWHDATWERVADPATLPAGIQPTDPVADATWDQVSQIRTRGGAPVATLRGMISAAAEYAVPLMIELRNGVADPQGIVDFATESGANVSFYQQPSATCDLGDLPALAAAGAPIGLKLSDDLPCQLTAAQIQGTGASYVTQAIGAITPAYTTNLWLRGVAVYARWATQDNARTALDNGAEKVMVDRPAEAQDW
jgi:hypothetical protein